MNKVNLNANVNIYWQVIHHYVGDIKGSWPEMFGCHFEKQKKNIGC